MPPSQSSSSMSASMLDRIREHEPQAWDRLARLYGPLVYRWCRRSGLTDCDAADASQEVFRAVARSIGGFHRDQPSDSFRGWLWQITKNKIRDHFRRHAGQPRPVGGTEAVQRMAEMPDDATAESIDSEFDSQGSLAHRALELVRPEFEDRTWQAFMRVVVGSENAAHVAGDLKISVGAVYTAKWRVLRRLREEMEGLL